MIQNLKLRFFKIVFRLISFLTDKTKGAKPFVHMKTMLGILIISLSASVSQSCKDQPDVTCYVPLQNDTTKVDSTSYKVKPIEKPVEKKN